MSSSRRCAVAALVLILGSNAAASVAASDPSHVDMVVGATGRDGGALAIRYDFSRPVLVTPSVSDGGFTRYSSTQPGFAAVPPGAGPGGGVEPLRDGVPVRLEAVAVDPDVSLKIGATTLDAPGKVVALGTAPNLHVHGEWGLLLPDGALAARRITLRLTTSARGYRPSAPYTFLVTNDPSLVTVPTTTTLPGVREQGLAGSRLTMVSAGDESKVTVVARDGRFTLTAGDDPRIAGAVVRFALRGSPAVELSHPLPAAGWRALRGGKGYRYGDRGRNGPIRMLVLRPGRGIKLHAAGAGLPAMPTTAPERVELVIEAPAGRWCLLFRDLARFRPGKRLVAAPAPAPASCPGT